MIHVDRSRVPMPEVLRPDVDSIWAQELARATEHYSASDRPDVSSRDYPFKVYIHDTVKAALGELFHSKCAYCETRVGVTGPPDIEHFRPKSFILDDHGDRHTGYWWLAGAWDNLMIACVACNRRHRSGGKGNHFPILGPRAQPFASDDELKAEEPLLLDPTVDHPETELVFTRDGLVVSERERGRASIEIIGLNRPELVSARKAHLDRLASDLERFRAAAEAGDEEVALALAEQLTHALDDDAEYAGAARQVLGPMLDALDSPPDVVEGARGKAIHIDQASKERAESSYEAYRAEQSDFSISDAIQQKAAVKERPSEPIETPDLEKMMRYDWRVGRIHIENVKAIKELDIDLSASLAELDERALAAELQRGPGDEDEPTPKAPWTVLLGENATGKSTVLDAVVLALIGREYVEQLVDAGHVRPSEFVRFGEDAGTVTVHLTPVGGTITSERTIRFEQRSDDERANISFEGAAEHAQNYVLAYGATRLLSPSRADAAYGTPWARVDNLFSPFQPLAPPEQLLRRLAEHEPEKFEITRHLWSEELSPMHSELDLRDGEVVLVENGVPVPIRMLSDGYQTALALVTDTLDVVFSLFDGPDVAEGLVVVDELGSHLHPTWKMRVVRQLRRLLPNMQFLATTHDPLCLRGLVDREIVLMQRHEEGYAFGRSDLDSPAGMRVDQLLTSRLFGLSSTIDPDWDEVFDEYYQLLAMEPAELEQHGKTDRLAELREKTRGVGMLGYTRRDQLIYEAVDEFLAVVRAHDASAATTGTEELEARKREVFRKVGNLWSYRPVLERTDGEEGEP